MGWWVKHIISGSLLCCTLAPSENRFKVINSLPRNDLLTFFRNIVKITAHNQALTPQHRWQDFLNMPFGRYICNRLKDPSMAIMDYSSIPTFKWYFLHKVKCVFQILTTTEIVGSGEYSQGLEPGDMYNVCFFATTLPNYCMTLGKSVNLDWCIIHWEKQCSRRYEMFIMDSMYMPIRHTKEGTGASWLS